MAWAFEGSAGIASTSSSAGNTIVTASTSVTAGELLVAVFRWEGTTGDTITGTVSDSMGLTWAIPRYSGTPSGESQRHTVSWAVVEATGNITVTWTFDSSATRGYRMWQLLRFSFAGGFTLAGESQAANGANVSTWEVPELSVGAGDLVLLTLAHFNSGPQPQTPSGFSFGYDAGLLESFYRVYESAGAYSYSTGWVSGTESYATLGFVFAETGGGTTYTLSAEAGSYITSGADASLLFNRAIAADAGAYSLTGIDTALLRGYSMSAESGSYLLAGTDASLAFNRVLVAESGSYTLSGADAALLRGFLVSAEGGSYALTGVDAAFSIKYILAAESGLFGLTGSDATLDYSGASTWTTQPNASSIWSAQPNSSSAWAVQSDNSTTWTVQ